MKKLIEDVIEVFNISKSIGNFYVYSLNYSDNIPFYIGVGQWDRKSSGNRYEDHILESFNPKDNSNLHKIRTIQKILKTEHKIIINILSQYETIDEAFEREIELIATYGRRVDGTGILTNLTLGGDGVSGIDRSGPKNPMFGKTMPESAREKLRLHHIGTVVDDKTRKKMSQTHLHRLAAMSDLERAFRNSLPKKLTESDVKYIRSIRINSIEDKRNIAEKFDITVSSINDILARRSYKWVD